MAPWLGWGYSCGGLLREEEGQLLKGIYIVSVPLAELPLVGFASRVESAAPSLATCSCNPGSQLSYWAGSPSAETTKKVDGAAGP